MSAEVLFTTPFGEFNLSRFPLRKDEQLRAWDAADEYLLSYLQEQGVDAGSRVLILNDGFGALTLALSAHQPSMMSDSHIATWSTRENMQTNGIGLDAVELLTSLDELEGNYDLVLVKVTKTLALLEHQLIQLKPHLTETSRVIGCGMVKQIHTSTLKLFEKYIGTTRTSLAKKKSRLIFSTPDVTIKPESSPYPTCYNLEGTGYRICDHASVFSRGKLDQGTRLLLQHIPVSDQFHHMIDLGCGNGIVGLLAAEKNPQAEILFTDESYMAVASAEMNFTTSGLANPAAFLATDCLDGVAEGSTDLVLCNPPFHQQQTVGDHIAWRMFLQSRQVLRPGGELCVIGNRHLGYHIKLKRLFGNCETVASDRKFVVLSALRGKN